ALVINAPIEGVEFVRLVAKKAYDLGAKNVHINWADDELTFLKYKHASDEVIENVPGWKVDMQEGFAEDGAAFLSIHARDPDLLKDIVTKIIVAENIEVDITIRKFIEFNMNIYLILSIYSI